jgi:hypothetical protein
MTCTLVTNGARFDHLIGLAHNLEKAASHYGAYKKFRALQLAAVYRDMAFEAMPSAAAIQELNLGERSRLAAKLRAMTVDNGCTPAEAENAAQLLLKLEGGQ